MNAPRLFVALAAASLIAGCGASSSNNSANDAGSQQDAGTTGSTTFTGALTGSTDPVSARGQTLVAGQTTTSSLILQLSAMVGTTQVAFSSDIAIDGHLTTSTYTADTMKVNSTRMNTDTASWEQVLNANDPTDNKGSLSITLTSLGESTSDNGLTDYPLPRGSFTATLVNDESGAEGLSVSGSF